MPGSLRFQIYQKPPAEYFYLWKEHKKGLKNFLYLDFHFQKLIRGDFLLLKNRFRLQTVSLYREGRPCIFGTVFIPRGEELPVSVGALVFSQINPKEAEYFWQKVRENFRGPIVAPMNGHHYLGFALPSPDSLAEKIGFQTSALHSEQETLFSALRGRPYRSYHSLETKITPELIQKLKNDLRVLPAGFSVRSFSRLKAKRDFSYLNQIVNKAFTKHFGFFPLTDEENWDLFRFLIPLLRRSHLSFLEFEQKPVGFCFGSFDYNRSFTTGSDLGNILRFLVREKPKRARLIHIGLLPEFQGKGLVKHIRHQMILSMAEEGVDIIENSYIDEGNENSLANVKSTGAKPLHQFEVFRVL